MLVLGDFLFLIDVHCSEAAAYVVLFLFFLFYSQLFSSQSFFNFKTSYTAYLFSKEFEKCHFFGQKGYGLGTYTQGLKRQVQ